MLLPHIHASLVLMVMMSPTGGKKRGEKKKKRGSIHGHVFATFKLIFFCLCVYSKTFIFYFLRVKEKSHSYLAMAHDLFFCSSSPAGKTQRKQIIHQPLQPHGHIHTARWLAQPLPPWWPGSPWQQSRDPGPWTRRETTGTPAHCTQSPWAGCPGNQRWELESVPNMSVWHLRILSFIWRRRRKFALCIYIHW